MGIDIKELAEKDSQWAWNVMRKYWGSLDIIVGGKIYNVQNLRAFIALIDGDRFGIIYYTFEKEVCKIITLNSLQGNFGIGTALLTKIESIAKENNAKHISVTTTNDNLQALKFYKKSGFKISEIRKNIINEYRIIKPQIPMVGENGIPIKDEIKLIKIIE